MCVWVPPTRQQRTGHLRPRPARDVAGDMCVVGVCGIDALIETNYISQRMSVALHMAAAWEIARELSLAGAEDEAALFGGGVADSVA